MMTVSHFYRQNDAGLRALNVVLWESLALIPVLVRESKGPDCFILESQSEFETVPPSLLDSGILR